jgi:hypothetical protein
LHDVGFLRIPSFCLVSMVCCGRAVGRGGELGRIEKDGIQCSPAISNFQTGHGQSGFRRDTIKQKTRGCGQSHPRRSQASRRRHSVNYFIFPSNLIQKPVGKTKHGTTWRFERKIELIGRSTRSHVDISKSCLFGTPAIYHCSISSNPRSANHRLARSISQIRPKVVPREGGWPSLLYVT